MERQSHPHLNGTAKVTVVTPPRVTQTSSSAKPPPPPPASTNKNGSTPPVRFVLDLRKPPPPPNSHCERCSELENEVKALKESQRALLAQINSLTRQLNSTTASTTNHSSSTRKPRNVETSSSDDQAELEKTKMQLRRLQEEHKVALELIVALGATVAAAPVSSSPGESQYKRKDSTASMRSTPSKSEKPPPFVAPSDKSDTFNAYAIYGQKKPEPSPAKPQKRSPQSSRPLPEGHRDRIGT